MGTPRALTAIGGYRHARGHLTSVLEVMLEVKLEVKLTA
jgi:hypothetical protein